MRSSVTHIYRRNQVNALDDTQNLDKMGKTVTDLNRTWKSTIIL